MRQQTMLNLLTASFFVFVVPFLLFPIYYTIERSLQTKVPFSSEYAWAGFSNYVSLASDPEFWGSLLFGSVWALSTVALQSLVGIGLAILLTRTFKGRSIVRSILFIPYFIPVTVVATVWLWLLNDTYGLLNQYFAELGLIVTSWWDVSHAPITLTLVAVWTYAPFVMLYTLAGLQTIPEELYDAAKIDGASAINRFRHVTAPQLKEVVFVVILLRIIWMFHKFDLPWTLTRGGPLTSTQNLPVFAYRLAFYYYDINRASAASIILLIVIGGVALLYMRVYKL